MANDASDEEFLTQSNNYLDWLLQNGAIISPKITIADLRDRNAGRGVQATREIAEDEELFSIPRSGILTVETSDLPLSLKQAVPDPWLSLILAMVFEFQRGEGSKWKPYFDVLPSQFDTLMYWSADQLQALQGSAVVSKIGKASADEAFTTQIIPLIRSNSETFHGTSHLSDDDLLALCHRMGSTIMAYAFDLEPPEDSDPNSENNGNPDSSSTQEEWEEDADPPYQKGMIPLADTLNADAARNNSKLFYSSARVVMRSLRKISAEEELYNDYGPLPRADLLRRYGYFTGNYAGYDVVEIGLELIRETAFQGRIGMGVSGEKVEERLRYLEEEGIVEDGYDVARRESEEGQFSEELASLLNGLTMSEEEWEKIVRKGKVPKPDLTSSAAAAGLLYRVLVSRMALYPTDMDFTAQAQSAVEGKRSRMARQVIEGEKAVLREAVDAVMELMSNSPENGNSTSNRKRKADNFDDDVAEARRSKSANKQPRTG